MRYVVAALIACVLYRAVRWVREQRAYSPSRVLAAGGSDDPNDPLNVLWRAYVRALSR